MSMALILGACAGKESSNAVAIQNTQSSQSASTYSGPRHPIVIGNFDNSSPYGRGIFTDGEDRLGGQAKTVLMGHLQRTKRFRLMDRGNMKNIEREAGYSNIAQNIKGAKYALTGDVVEFGRKDIGDTQLFGIVGRGKKQVAYSKVTLNVVDVVTSEVVFSASGAGEYALSDREILGFGGNSGYDSTLNGKVLDLSIRQAVDNLVVGLESGEWDIQ